MPKVSLSLILPVYDDDAKLSKVITELEDRFLKLSFTDYELLVFLSRNVRESDKLVGDNANVKVFREDSREIGVIFARGIKESHKDWVGIWPAYDQISPKSLDAIVPGFYDNDIVVAFIENPEARQWHRRFFSALNTFLLNLLFGLNIRYYHLPFFRTVVIRNLKITSKGHAAISGTLIRIIKSGRSFVQSPFIMNPHYFPSKSGAFRFGNIKDIALSHSSLFWEMIILKKKAII